MSEIRQCFLTLKGKCHLVSASGLNLVNRELPSGSRVEKNNGGEQSCQNSRPNYIHQLHLYKHPPGAAKNKSDPVTPGPPGHMGRGRGGNDLKTEGDSPDLSWVLSDLGLDHFHDSAQPKYIVNSGKYLDRHCESKPSWCSAGPALFDG